jgi:hypothetical protein
MIIGFDCQKYDANLKKFVMSASYDPYHCRYYNEIEAAKIDEKSTGFLINLIKKCLNFFGSHWGGLLPEKIIIYRSGVSEYEKREIMQNEVLPLKNFLSGDMNEYCYKKDYDPKFTFVLVNKRSEAKFFENQEGIQISNPRAGLVIDTQVTSSEMYEFYLQPHDVSRGTATMTHFHCIYDSIELELEKLEDITHRLCYYYWNWPGAIRIPSALKFAEVANKFSSKYLSENVRDTLRNSPYFI